MRLAGAVCSSLCCLQGFQAHCRTVLHPTESEHGLHPWEWILDHRSPASLTCYDGRNGLHHAAAEMCAAAAVGHDEFGDVAAAPDVGCADVGAGGNVDAGGLLLSLCDAELCVLLQAVLLVSA